MNFGKFFIIDLYKKIKHNLPDYVLSSALRLIPFNFISSVFEIFGLVVLFPILKVILDPSYIYSNKYIYFFYTTLHFTNNVSFVLFLFSSVTAVFIIKNLIIFFIAKHQTNVAYNLASRISLEKYYTYLNKPYHFHAENNTAVLLRNFTQIPYDIISFVFLPFIAILNEIFILTLIILLLTLYDPALFWSLVLFSLPFIFIYSSVYKKKLKKISDRRNIETALMYKLGLQSMEAYREITVFTKSNYFKPVFKKNIDNYSKSMSEVYLMNIFSPKIVETVAILGIFSIFIFGYIFNKELTSLAQFLLLFAIAAYRVIPSINKIILCTNNIKATYYIFDVFDKPEIDSLISKENTFKKQVPKLEFKDVLELKKISFVFPSKEQKVLTNLNLIIKKGQTIGIIGTSGAGKTTLLNILLRLYEETEGEIYLDKTKIDKTNLESWYNIVSYVPQNITLLDGTLLENIAFGIYPEEIDYSLLKKVIQQAQLELFIQELPEGINSKIGEKGIKISGGQRQRIGIARALYHGGKILIFDEATSSLDNETEKMLTDAIHYISHKELTIIIVAHRLQTLKHCDKIYKLENGVLNETFDINIKQE